MRRVDWVLWFTAMGVELLYLLAGWYGYLAP